MFGLLRFKRRPAASPEAEPALEGFAAGSRPVIRWIKGDGLDDVVTRSAIGQATRLFGSAVDYCLCTAGIGAARAREVLAWAAQPVEWRPVGPDDNPELAALLKEAGCEPEAYGYWWKWFPERLRPGAPEWILDGDMVVTAAPSWFAAWRDGRDTLRVSQDDRWPAKHLYGGLHRKFNARQKLYSGLISLPPGLCYMDRFAALLKRHPLKPGHDGRKDMTEQGVVASTFASLRAMPIPLYEFPFGRAFEEALDFGGLARKRPPWGYHFGFAFRRENPHFRRLAAEGTVYWRDGEIPPGERFRWLGNRGQWGREGWSMEETCVERIAALARAAAGRPALEIGTSRGFLTAVMAESGAQVTTIDHADRGAARNLAGMDAKIIRAEATEFLAGSSERYDLIVVDLHGNGEEVWQKLWPLLEKASSPSGVIVLYNSHLWRIPEWRSETGLRWVAENKLAGYALEVHEKPPPGMIVCRRG